MNRIFHSKVGGIYIALMCITAVALFYTFWVHDYIPLFIFAMAMLFEIEMLIHTQYIVTADNYLLVETGRFVPNVKIALQDIVEIKHIRSANVAPALAMDRIQITYRYAANIPSRRIRKVQLSPKKSEEMIALLIKRNHAIVKVD